MEKGKVQNPLTIIAIFAGIAEVAGTIVLLGLPLEIQLIFVWFVAMFPVLLVLLFFLILILKHEVLYAPSDFKDEEYFIKLMSNKQKYQSGLNDVKESVHELKTLTERAGNDDAKTTDIFEKLKDGLELAEKRIEIAQEEIAHEEIAQENMLGSLLVRRPIIAKSLEDNIIELLSSNPGGLTINEINKKLGGVVALDFYLRLSVENGSICKIGERYYFGSENQSNLRMR